MRSGLPPKLYFLDCLRWWVVVSQHCRIVPVCIARLIGLVRKEFHILNQPYDRKTYFANEGSDETTLAVSVSRFRRSGAGQLYK